MAKNKEKLQWKLEMRNVSDLIPADYNPRKLSEKAQQDLRNSVTKFGQVEPLVVNADGKVIGGHSRIKVYADLKMEETPVMVPNRQLSQSEERELNLRLNKNTGEWDWTKMKEFFSADELTLAGFEDDELRMQFGLSDAGDVELDDERMQILAVYPPEAVKLKERVAIHFGTKAEYDKVKKAINSGKLDASAILGLI